MPQQQKKSSTPIAGGILLIIAAIMALLNYAFVMVVFDSEMSMYAGLPGVEGVEAIIMICFLIGMIFSVIALIGGIVAIQRKLWGLALTGSIFGLLTIGPLFASSLLSLIALILIAISHKDFT